MLVHFSREPLNTIESRSQIRDPLGMKPKGLWVSDESSYGWKEWCAENEFNTSRFAFAHQIHLKPDAKILRIDTVEKLQAFDREYALPKFMDLNMMRGIDWARLAETHQGILISPYQWSCRMDLLWYYGWDCASGCVWDADAIERITIYQEQSA